jgi:TusA-related sulfurtransferase
VFHAKPTKAAGCPLRITYKEGILLKSDCFLDCVGLACPLPLLKAKKVLQAMKPGQMLAVVATDEGAEADFKAFCLQTGHILKKIDHEGHQWTVWIQHRGESL